MKVAVENYKGIEFVRISTLPEDQKKGIWNSLLHQKIVKILRDNRLLNDCLLYDDYADWYKRNYTLAITSASSQQVDRAKELKLVHR